MLDSFLVHMCRKCTAVQHYDGLHDSIFSSSKAFLFTYKLCFNDTDSMLLMRLPLPQWDAAFHWQQLLAKYRHSGQAQCLCACGTHRNDAGNASAHLRSQCCHQCWCIILVSALMVNCSHLVRVTGSMFDAHGLTFAGKLCGIH